MAERKRERGAKMTPEQKLAHKREYALRLIERRGTPVVTECPQFLGRMDDLLERRERGETISEREVFGRYFERMAEMDPQYMRQVERVVAQMDREFPEKGEQLLERSVQIVVPAYREGDTIPRFIELVEQQMEKTTDDGNWGMTIVLNHRTPPYEGKRYSEAAARAEMSDQLDEVYARFPEMKGRVDYFFHYRGETPETPMLIVGLPRKLGEDTNMMLYMRALEEEAAAAEEAGTEPPEHPPLYLGMMDMDTGDLTPDLFDEVAKAARRKPEDNPSIIRAQGSFDRTELAEMPYVYALEMMWEGFGSDVAENTEHQAFNMGRFSVFPARELAMTGGGHVEALEFPDEDIRRGMQVRWQMDGVDVIEVEGRYATSARREAQTVKGLMQLLEDGDGTFDLETLQVGALIRQYGSWGDIYRGTLSEGAVDASVYEDPEKFAEQVPSQLIETLVNSFYRFTLHSIHAVDQLSKPEGLPEVQALRQQFLDGEIPYFRVQLDTMNHLREISKNRPDEFDRIRPLLEEVDNKARTAVRGILEDYGVDYEEDTSMGPILGLLEEPAEGMERDRTPIQAPFKIADMQPGFAQKLKGELEATLGTLE